MPEDGSSPLWTKETSFNGHRPNRRTLLAKAINVVTRPLFQKYAVGVPDKGGYREAGAVMNEGNRLLFITPWRGHSLIGTTYSAYDGNPDSSTVTEGNIQDFLNQINNARSIQDTPVPDTNPPLWPTLPLYRPWAENPVPSSLFLY